MEGKKLTEEERLLLETEARKILAEHLGVTELRKKMRRDYLYRGVVYLPGIDPIKNPGKKE